MYNVPGRTGCNVDPATLLKLSSIPTIVGVKEASGNVTQMAEICRSVPAEFLVLSGDDALTLPLMAIGGRGIISVASNEAPAEMVQMVEAAERGDYKEARHWHDEAAAADAGQLRRIESRPREVRDGRDGPVRRSVPAADGAAAPDLERQSAGRAQGTRYAHRRRSARVTLAERIGELFAQGAHADKAAARDAFVELRALLDSGEVRAAEPDASSPSGWRVNTWVKQGILLGFRFGVTIDVSADHGRWPFYDKDTLPLKKPGVEAGVRIVPGGSTIREGAFVDRSVVCMPPMFINIGAYVGEGSLDRFARARRIVRAGRQARARQRGRANRRRHRARRRAACDHRRRCVARRKHRRL